MWSRGSRVQAPSATPRRKPPVDQGVSSFHRTGDFAVVTCADPHLEGSTRDRRRGAAGCIDPADVKRGIESGNAASLLERFLEPREIAHLAAYLASPLASATNGAAIRAEGGVLTTTL
ncbi:SDR family oxidoreductase [Microbacterium oryzae]|uniref:SDR family oxidoreductase n=1 Tax=Microbacterium oryzae TaxID=743009 RepID=A0A6I6DY95_9MICO|nr:SDR family oxidoreductase [Microbacterium oryzae]